jgi:hypothetical protein
MALQTLSKTDLNDILNGAVILASGGGGPVSSGRLLLADVLAHQKPVQIADPMKDVPDDATMAVAFFHSPIYMPPNVKIQFDDATRSFQALSKVQQAAGKKPFSFLLPVEVGAESMIPMTVAVRTGLPLVDGDSAGRAINTLAMSNYAGNNIPVAPITVANAQAAVTVSAPGVLPAEGPMWATIGGAPFNGNAGMSFWSMDGAMMKQAIVPNTLTKARLLGKTLREALKQGKDPVKAVVDHLGGWLLFKGKLVDANTPLSDLAVGSVTIQGRNKVRSIVYNLRENLMIWRSDRASPLAMGPDPICYLTTDGEVFSNEDLSPVMGKEVVVIGHKAHPSQREPAIVDVYLQTFKSQLAYAGPYVPIEQLQAKGKS